MKKRTLVYILIASFINLTIGCTAYRPTKLNINELGESGINVINISINDSIYTFLNKEAVFYKIPLKIEGYDFHNSFISIPIDSIKTIIEPQISIKNIDSSSIIKKMLLFNNAEIVFNSEGGKLLDHGYLIKGKQPDSTSFSVRTNNIDYLTINKLDVTGTIVKNFFLVGGILLGALFIFGVLLAKSFHGGLAG